MVFLIGTAKPEISEVAENVFWILSIFLIGLEKFNSGTNDLWTVKLWPSKVQPLSGLLLYFMV